MSTSDLRLRAILLALLALSGCAAVGERLHGRKAQAPAAEIVEREGGRRVRLAPDRLALELRGPPDLVGRQHGALLGPEVARTVEALRNFAEAATGEPWRVFRAAARRIVLPQLAPEQRAEIAGIVEGARRAGVTVEEADLVALNAWEDLLGGYFGQRPLAGHGVAASTAVLPDGSVEVRQRLALPAPLGEQPRIVQTVAPASGGGYVTETLPGQIRSASGLYVTTAGLVLAHGGTASGELDRLGAPAALRAHAAVAAARGAPDLVQRFAERAATTRGGTWLLVDLGKRQLYELDGSGRAPLLAQAALGERVLPGGSVTVGDELRLLASGDAFELAARRLTASGAAPWITLSARGRLPSMKIAGTVRRSEFGGMGWELHADGGEVYELELGATAAKDLKDGKRVEVEGRIDKDAASIQMRGPRLRVDKLSAK